MAAGGDQPQQMLEWIKKVRKAGYIVDTDKLLYKIRHPQTGGLIMTAPQFPRGNQVLRDTLNRAKQRGIVVEEQPEKRHAGGQTPPPVFGETVAVDEPTAKNGDEELAQEPAQPARTEKKPHWKRDPVRMKRTERVRKGMAYILEQMGDTPDNRFALWQYGRDALSKKGLKIPCEGASNLRKTVLYDHMGKILSGRVTVMSDSTATFWERTFVEVRKHGLPGSREKTGAEKAKLTDTKEEIVTQTTAETTTEDLREQLFHMRESMDALVEELETTRADLEKQTELRRQAERRAIETAGKTGSADGSPVSDELSVTVLKRMLLVSFPDGEKQIDDAIDFSREVARRTSA